MSRQQWDQSFYRASRRIVSDAMLSPDSKTAIFTIKDSVASRLIAYNTSTGKIIWDKEEGEPDQLDISPSAQEVAAFFANHGNCNLPILRRFRLDTGEELPLKGANLKYESNGYGLKYSDDGTQLITSIGMSVSIWNTATGNQDLYEPIELGLKPAAEYYSVRRPSHIALSADKTRIALTWSVAVRLWSAALIPGKDIQTLKPLGYFGLVPNFAVKNDGIHEPNTIISARLNPDGSRIVVLADQWSRIYDTRTNKLLKSFDPSILILQFDSSGDLMVKKEGKIQRYSLQSGTFSEVLTLKNPDATFNPLKNGQVLGLLWTHNTWGADYSDSTSATLIDQKTGAVLQHFRLPGRMDLPAR